MLERGFARPLSAAGADELRRRAHECRGGVLTATSVAASGHPGGSLSSMEIHTVLCGCAGLRPEEPRWPARDRLVVSHGHTSPGAYCALAAAGFFPLQEVEAHFRQTGSVFEGHVERSVPGVEWATGNLGQGLSAGVGFALAARLTGGGWHTYVAMSDGEQMKGQVGEARRLAVKLGLTALTAVVDMNGIQISGRTEDVMPVRVAEGFLADGWRVAEVDGHDVAALHSALLEARAEGDAPTAILASTTIGKGVSFMEGEAEYHGRALTREEYGRAMAELGLEPRLDEALARRSRPCAVAPADTSDAQVSLAVGEPATYSVGSDVDCRSAWGAALADMATADPGVPMAVLDCDLMTSVKTDAFADARPSGFVQCGVGEHDAATVAGALSVSGVATFWADFGVFGIDEAYNQQRLNDINRAAVKLAVTHCGLDVGEDGKTHQCVDYVGALRSMPGWRVVVPADANQADRAVRWAAGQPGCIAIAMGRSRLPVLAGSDGAPLFGGERGFDYGEIVWAREGGEACVLAMGTPAGEAIAASEMLAREGIGVAVGVVACPLGLDEGAMERAASPGTLVTVEDHSVESGLGASVAIWLAQRGSGARLVRIGVRGYGRSGPARELLAAAGLDAEGIAAAVRGAVAG